MKITVDRTNTPEGNLVFTVTVTEPHFSFFGEEEKQVMDRLDVCKNEILTYVSHASETKDLVLDAMHAVKAETFIKVLKELKFSIKNELTPMFKPICQEIYNWMYDYQTGALKTWMCEFDPQRTKYYFNNDINAHTQPDKQQSEHDEMDIQD